MRNRSPRSFTVENKSAGRHQRTFIPHRASAPTIPRPALSWPPPAELQAPIVEPRRILPSLIVPEPEQIEPEPIQLQPERVRVSAERSLQPRRGRPPKAKPVVAEAAQEPMPEPAVEVSPTKPAGPPASRTLIASVMRTATPPAALPLGERWKRRLGRWAR